MAGIRTLSEIEARISIIQDNIRQLIEQAAAASGAENEAFVSDRIAQQTEELERLTNERDALAKNTS
jgi:uncharacterized protein (DUF1778 family)